MVCATLLIVGACSSGGGGKPQIKYGTPAGDIAKQLGICANPERVTANSVRCRFPDGQIVAVDSIGGPADQQLEVPAARANDFCELVGHGFGLTGLSFGELKAHVHLNAIVAKYGGKFAGAGC